MPPQQRPRSASQHITIALDGACLHSQLTHLCIETLKHVLFSRNQMPTHVYQMLQRSWREPLSTLPPDVERFQAQVAAFLDAFYQVSELRDVALTIGGNRLRPHECHRIRLPRAHCDDENDEAMSIGNAIGKILRSGYLHELAASKASICMLYVRCARVDDEFLERFQPEPMFSIDSARSSTTLELEGNVKEGVEEKGAIWYRSLCHLEAFSS